MINSIPCSALSLGIGFEEYEELARSVKDIILIPKHERENLVKSAGILLDKDIQKKIIKLVEDVAEDRRFYEIAGLKYWKGPPEGENIFTTTIVHYVLQNI